jgi:hypothetical protein
MLIFSRIFFILGILAMLPWLEGCFTEIGNAEDDRLVHTEFRIDYSENPHVLGKGTTTPAKPDSVRILQFYMLVHEAAYVIKDSVTGNMTEKHLWAEDSISDPVDFTGTDLKAGLTVQSIGIKTPESIQFELKIVSHSLLNPMLIDFMDFHEKGYLTGIFGIEGKGTNFIFALPTGNEIHMSYSKATLLGWYKDKTYHMKIEFFAAKWLANTDISKAQKVMDKTGREFVLLDANNNSALYKTLLDAFYKSFNTLSVSI